MLETLFWVTYVALWLLMILVLVALFSLYRYHGTLFINSSEGRAAQGPKLNEPLKSMYLRDTAGMNVLMGESSNSSQFVFFASTKCAPCIKARDALGLFAERHKGTIETILVCQGKDEHVREFTKDMPEHIKAVSDPHWQIGASLRISLFGAARAVPILLAPFTYKLRRIGYDHETAAEVVHWFVKFHPKMRVARVLALAVVTAISIASLF